MISEDQFNGFLAELFNDIDALNLIVIQNVPRDSILFDLTSQVINDFLKQQQNKCMKVLYNNIGLDKKLKIDISSSEHNIHRTLPHYITESESSKPTDPYKSSFFNDIFQSSYSADLHYRVSKKTDILLANLSGEYFQYPISLLMNIYRPSKSECITYEDLIYFTNKVILLNIWRTKNLI